MYYITSQKIIIYDVYNRFAFKCLCTLVSIIRIMPQLVPFYFTNQVSFVFVIMVISIYMFSKYILPMYVSLYTTRITLNKF